jgi:hypothetical protein
MQTKFQGLKPQDFLGLGRRHECLLHPVIDEELCKGERLRAKG